MNKGMIFAGVLVIAVVAGFAWLASSFDKIVETIVEEYGSEMTGTDVALDSASVSPTEGQGRLSGLSIGSPEGFAAGYTATLGEIDLAIDPSTIQDDVVVINKIGVISPQITVELNKDGLTNLQALQKNVQDYIEQLSGDDGGSSESREPADDGKETKLIVDEFRLTDGKIKLDATSLGLGEAEALLPEIVLKDIGRPEGGVTPAKVVEIILDAIETNAMSAVNGLGIAGLDQYLDKDSLIDKGLEKLGVDGKAKDAIKNFFNR